MARKSYEYQLEITADVDGLDDAEREIERIAEAMEGTGDAARDALTILGAATDDMEAEFRGTASAADALKLALGDAFDGDSARVETFVTQLRGMGLEFDQIEAKAKEFADVIQRADNVKLDAVNSGLTNVGGSLDRVRASGDQSRSVLANLAGNSAQDLGELGGVVGTLGVGIGQLAEYAVDGNISLKNLAAVAGPMAGLAAVTAIGTKLWGDYQKRQQEVAENTAEAAEELLDITGIVEALNDELRAQGEVGDFGDQLVASLNAADDEFNEVLAAATGLGVEFTDLGDIIAGLGAKGTASGFQLMVGEIQESLGVTREQAEGIADAINSGADNWATLAARIDAANTLTNEQRDALREQLELWLRIGQAASDSDIDDIAEKFITQLSTTVDGLEQVQAARDRLAGQGILDPSNIQIATEVSQAVDGAAEAADRWAQANREIDPNDLRWTLVRDGANALREGMALTETQMQAIDALMAEYGLTQEQVLDQGIQLWDDHQTKLKEAGEAAAEYERALGEAGREISRIVAELPDIGDEFASALDAGDATVDFQGMKASVDDAIDELQAYIDENGAVDWSALLDMSQLDPSEIDADMVSVVAGVRDALQSGIVSAFELGGTQSAQHFLDTFLPQLMEQGGLTEQEALQLLGLPEDGTIDAVLAPIVDADKAERARGILDALAGANVSDPRIAQIQVLLESDQIDGEMAYIISQIIAHEAGIAVYPVVDETTTAEEIAAAQAYIDGMPLTLTGEIDTLPVEKSIDEISDGRKVPLEAEAVGVPEAGGELDEVAEERTAPVDINIVQYVIALALMVELAKSRTATITANALTAEAGLELDNVAADRTAYVDAVLRNLPTYDEIVNRITGGRGAIIVPVDTRLRYVARIDGSRVPG